MTSRQLRSYHRSQRERKLVKMRGKPRIVGRKRGGKWKWVVFSTRRSQEFTVWDHAIVFANTVSPASYRT